MLPFLGKSFVAKTIKGNIYQNQIFSSRKKQELTAGKQTFVQVFHEGSIQILHSFVVDGEIAKHFEVDIAQFGVFVECDRLVFGLGMFEFLEVLQAQKLQLRVVPYYQVGLARNMESYMRLF